MHRLGHLLGKAMACLLPAALSAGLEVLHCTAWPAPPQPTPQPSIVRVLAVVVLWLSLAVARATVLLECACLTLRPGCAPQWSSGPGAVHLTREGWVHGRHWPSVQVQGTPADSGLAWAAENELVGESCTPGCIYLYRRSRRCTQHSARRPRTQARLDELLFVRKPLPSLPYKDCVRGAVASKSAGSMQLSISGPQHTATAFLHHLK